MSESSGPSVFSSDDSVDLNCSNNAGDDDDLELENETPVSSLAKELDEEDELEESEKAELDQGIGPPIIIEEAIIPGDVKWLEDNPIETEAELEALFDSSYPQDTVRPTKDGILTHKQKVYILHLIKNRSTTVYYADTQSLDPDSDTPITRAKKKKSECYFVPDQVMIELILLNQVVPLDYIIPDTNEVSKVLMPVSTVMFRAAINWVLDGSQNSHLRKFRELYPYWPIQYDLPKIAIPDDFKMNFEEWKPAPPTQEDWDKLKYAPGNIRYKNRTWAANCRHQTTRFDEHPWCGACYAKYGIVVCSKPTDVVKTKKKRSFKTNCYLCSKMSLKAVNAFHSSVDSWKDRVKIDPKDCTPAGKILASKVATQFHAGFISQESEDADKGAKTKVGFSRPINDIAVFMTSNEVLELGWEEARLKAKLHMTHFMLEYEAKAAGTYSVKWPDFVTLKAESEKQEAKKRRRDNLRRRRRSGPGPPPRRGRGSGPPPGSDEEGEGSGPDPDGKEEDKLSEEEDEEISAFPPPPRQLDTWVLDTPVVTIPYPDHTLAKREMYEAATLAAKRINPDTSTTDITEPDFTGEDAIFAPLIKKRRMSYKPTTRYVKHVNNTLAKYDREAKDPDFSSTIPVSLSSFPEGALRSEPPKAKPVDGKYPADYNTVPVLQREVSRLHAIIRALTRVHENDAINTTAVWVDRQKVERDRKAEADSENRKVDLEDRSVCAEAVINNFASREKLLAEAEAIVLAARRRDNAVRMGLEGADLNRVVSARIGEQEEPYLIRGPALIQVDRIECEKLD